MSYTVPKELPIEAHEPEAPILPSSRWFKNDHGLCKTYKFHRVEDKERFVGDLFAYERQVQHHAEMHLVEDEVELVVCTHNVGVTNVDYEYARFADAVYRDVVYSPHDGQGTQGSAG